MYNIVLVDLSPTFYCLPKPLLVHGSVLLLSTLILSSYNIIVVMLGCDWGLRTVINITCFKIPGSGFIFAASKHPSLTNREIIQCTSVLFTQAPIRVPWYVLMVLIPIVGLQYRPASKKLKYRLEAGFLIFLGA